MTTSRDSKKPLPKIRTFAQDLEDERAERAEGGTDKPTPPTVTISTNPIPKVPAPKPDVLVTPTTVKPAPAVPIVNAKTKDPAPTPVPLPVTASGEKDALPRPSVSKVITPPKVVTTSTPAHEQVRDTSYEATVITDNKHKRFNLGKEIVSSIKDWWKTQQKNNAAKRAPKYTVPQADLRKGVIQQATSQTGRGAVSDHSAVLARIRENTQNGKAALASQIQIKHEPARIDHSIATPIINSPVVPPAVTPPAPIVAPEPIIPPVTPTVVIPTPPPVIATPITIPPPITSTITTPHEPTLPIQTTVTQDENTSDLYEVEYETTYNQPRRGADVYIPYNPVEPEDINYDDDTHDTQPIEATSVPQSPSVPSRFGQPITPTIPGYIQAQAHSSTDNTDRFVHQARNLVAAEKKEIVSLAQKGGLLVAKIVETLSPRSLLQNPNHLVLITLLVSTLAFVGYIGSQTLNTNPANINETTTHDAVLFSDMPQQTVNLVAPNKSALFGSIAAKLSGGDSVAEIVFVDAAETPISTTAFATVFYNNLDLNFIASIKMVRFGIYRGTPWIAITVDNAATGKGGMLAWEPTISRDMEPLFGAAIGNPGRPQSSSFTDVVTNTKDTRVLADAAGNEKIIYGFINRDTIVITGTSLAFTNLSQNSQ